MYFHNQLFAHAVCNCRFALLQLLPNLRVMARSQPLDKKNLVTWYRSHGDVVAVTGDGTNDAPALMAADIGLAMGQQVFCSASNTTTEITTAATSIITTTTGTRSSATTKAILRIIIFCSSQLWLVLTVNQGTAVAKAAAGIIIQDDNFASIKRSVVWGRAVCDNVGSHFL